MSRNCLRTRQKKMRRKNRSTAFKFRPFSLKQKKLMYWWKDGSPHQNKNVVIADGAIRSGKTIAMIASFMQWSQSTFSNEDFIIAGKSIGALKRNVVKPLKQIITAWGWGFDHNRSENYIIIGSNTYYLFGANNEASQDVLQGLTAAGALGDEAALFPKSFLEQMIGRCSVEGAKIFLNCNPKSPYHYLKTEYIDLAGDKNIYRLHFTMNDNLTLSRSVREMYERMFTGVFYQRFILGLWVMAEGIIYDLFDRSLHVTESTERAYSRYYVSIDYGTNNPFAMGLWGLFEGTWYKIKEYHYSGREKQRQKTDSEYADDFESFIEGINLKAVIVDPSASSLIAELDKRGYEVMKANNEVEDGIRNVQSALKTGKVKYNDCCTETFREFNSYVWDEKAQERGEDKPVKQNDHHMDSDRYFIRTILFKGETKVNLLRHSL